MQTRRALHSKHARLQPLSATHNDRHTKDSRGRTARVSTPLCDRIPRRALLPDRLQSRKPRSDRLRSASLARWSGGQEARRQLRAVHSAADGSCEARLLAEPVALRRRGVRHGSRDHEPLHLHKRQRDRPEGTGHRPARRDDPRGRHAR